MAEQQRQSDNQDDGDEEFRCVADEEVPPEETKGPDAAGYRSHSSTLSDARASVG
jgi:hypothetical protein